MHPISVVFPVPPYSHLIPIVSPPHGRKQKKVSKQANKSKNRKKERKKKENIKPKQQQQQPNTPEIAKSLFLLLSCLSITSCILMALEAMVWLDYLK